MLCFVTDTRWGCKTEEGYNFTSFCKWSSRYGNSAFLEQLNFNLKKGNNFSLITSHNTKVKNCPKLKTCDTSNNVVLKYQKPAFIL